jgi:hypothetical protein
MNDIRRGLLTLVFCGIALALVACQSEEEEFIQGMWAIGNVHYWAEWDFKNGIYYRSYSYVLSRTTYETGRYRVIDRGEDYILLELTYLEGNMEVLREPYDLKIGFHADSDVVTIQGDEYYRVSAPSLDALATSMAP